MHRFRPFHLFVLLLSLVTLFALILGANRELAANSYAVHDDRLFLNLGINLARGEWLGQYNQLTLIKGPFYPLFLALNYFLGFPLLITQQIVYCCSGLALIYALSFFLRSYGYLLLIYLVYLFNPAIYYINQVTREGTYISLTTFVVAGSILMAAHLTGKCSQRVTLHSSLFGLLLAIFWLTREEGVWIFPSVAVILGIGVVGLLRQQVKLKGFLQQLRRSLAPGAIAFFACVLLISQLNSTFYRVPITRSELATPQFKEAMGALFRVKESHQNPYLPVSKEVREKLYATSELFRPLRSHLENPAIVNGWSGGSCNALPGTCGDYPGGWFLWAFRDAVASIGRHDSAPRALRYYRALAKEINQLCDSKRLDCEPFRSGTLPPLTLEHLQRMPAKFLKGVSMVSSLKGLSIRDAQEVLSDGGEADRSLFELFTHNQTTSATPRCDGRSLEAFGWINRKGVTLTLNEPTALLTQKTIPDPTLAPEIDSRFELNICCKTCKLSFMQQGQSIVEVDLLKERFPRPEGSNGLIYYLDVRDYDSLEIQRGKTAILEAINQGFYQGVLVFGVAIAAFLWLIRFIAVRYFPWTFVYWIATGCLVAVITRLMVVTIVDVTSFPAVRYLYLVPCIPLVSVFALLTMIDTLNVVQRSRPSKLPEKPRSRVASN